MTLVKSLLLGSAAGLVAVAGAQAADLPVKAKPVEYVKICSIYGAGFFYIPGTDTCIKIGGWIRAEYALPDRQLGRPLQPGCRRPQQPHRLGRAQHAGSLGDVARCSHADRIRHPARLHPRRLPDDHRRNLARPYLHRAWLHPVRRVHLRQVAVLLRLLRRCVLLRLLVTSGNASRPAPTARCLPPTRRRSATASPPRCRWKTASCAAMRCGMLTAPLMRSRSANAWPGLGPGLLQYHGGSTFGDYAGAGIPDIVGSLRVDQAWGSAQIAGALHQVRAGYYGNNTTGAGGNFGNVGPRRFPVCAGR